MTHPKTLREELLQIAMTVSCDDCYYEHETEDSARKAIEAILKLIEERLPLEFAHNETPDEEECACEKIEGWNAYRAEVLKVLRGEESK